MTDGRFQPTLWQAPETVVGRLLVLPGSGYTVDHPLLFWVCHVADSLGWHVCTMRWQVPSDADAEITGFVEDAATILERFAPDCSRTVVLAKSLGTLAAGWAGRRGYLGVWLTPLLGDAQLRTQLSTPPPGLLVGGTADRHWDARSAATTGCTVVEIEGANHALTIDGDWRASIEALTTVLAATEAFLVAAAG